MNKGLCIKGLDTVQISAKLSAYVGNHIKDFKLPVGQSLFQESYLLDYEDTKETIPDKYHHLFADTDMFNGLSGFIDADGKQYTIMLLADEILSKAYLLSIQHQDTKGGEISAIIGDFVCP